MVRDPIRIDFTGDIFQTQRFGGISRYFVELMQTLKLHDDIELAINAPIYVNSYLRRNRRTLTHRGLFVPKYWRGLSKIEQVASQLRDFMTPLSDIVHLTYYNPRILRRARAKKVITFYDMIHERFMPESPVVPWKRECYERVDHCFAISESTKADMLHFYGGDPDRITVTHLATNFSEASSSGDESNKLRVGHSRPTILWVGERHLYKNFQALLRGFANSRCRREGGMIRCIGGPPLGQDELSLAAALGIDESSLSQETCDDASLASFYRTSSLLAYVSSYEGFGLPPLEAMQCGCPVVASNRSSIPEVVGDAAVLVDPDDVAAIAAAIDAVAFDREMSEKLVAKGKARAAEFSWDRCGRQTASIYAQLCN